MRILNSWVQTNKREMTITYLSQRRCPLNLRYRPIGTANSIKPDIARTFILSFATVKIPAMFNAHDMSRITAQESMT